MKTITSYEAFDGKAFIDKEICRDYEMEKTKELIDNLVIIKKICKLYDEEDTCADCPFVDGALCSIKKVIADVSFPSDWNFDWRDK